MSNKQIAATVARFWSKVIQDRALLTPEQIASFEKTMEQAVFNNLQNLRLDDGDHFMMYISDRPDWWFETVLRDSNINPRKLFRLNGNRITMYYDTKKILVAHGYGARAEPLQINDG